MAAQASAEPETPFTTVTTNDHIAFGGQPAQTDIALQSAHEAVNADIID
jgi:hypothetical protein